MNTKSSVGYCSFFHSLLYLGVISTSAHVSMFAARARPPKYRGPLAKWRRQIPFCRCHTVGVPTSPRYSSALPLCRLTPVIAQSEKGIINKGLTKIFNRELVVVETQWQTNSKRGDIAPLDWISLVQISLDPTCYLQELAIFAPCNRQIKVSIYFILFNTANEFD